MTAPIGDVDACTCPILLPVSHWPPHDSELSRLWYSQALVEPGSSCALIGGFQLAEKTFHVKPERYSSVAIVTFVTYISVVRIALIMAPSTPNNICWPLLTEQCRSENTNLRNIYPKMSTTIGHFTQKMRHKLQKFRLKTNFGGMREGGGQEKMTRTATQIHILSTLVDYLR
ncbi:hypothetical protein B0H19DRAFT_1079573 [Mycena capillaripes]|nr:hypothetical protein B0H19DRAFT_1079573 [Mycena capillaripes]